jgi:hypothetical protein
MLYVFNSAYRPLYTVNVLNTLSLPGGFVNEYRYKYSDKTKYLSTDLLSSLDSLAKSKTETVITFIDRFAEGGYRYYPLRKGSLIGWKHEGDQVFLRISLADYLASKNPDEVTKALVEALGPKRLPVLTNGNPMEPHDGDYVIENADILKDLIEIGDNSWSKTVDAVSSASVFLASRQQASLFTRIRVEEASSQDEVKPSVKGTVSVYKLKKTGKYRAVLIYRFPAQIGDKSAHGEIQVSTDDNLTPSSTAVAIDSHANSVELLFHAAPKAEEPTGAIRIEPSTTENQPALLTSNAAMQYRLVQGGGFWVKLLFIALVYALASSLQASDLSTLWNACPSQIASAITPKLILGLVQIGTIYSAFRLLGTKIM